MIKFNLKEPLEVNFKKVFLDVGANDGNTSIPVAQSHPDTTVYAFEPTPKLIDIMRNKTKQLSNYIIIEKAVSIDEGNSTFRIAGQNDWGCSSLLEFSEKSQTEWPGRTDFKVTEEINVDVIRLDTFIEQYQITKIDWLHIDTQGNDLNVLKSMGKYIDIVLGGTMEAANKKDILYKGQNTKEECIQFLESNGFHITNITSNDEFVNEINIFFAKDPNYKNYWQ